LFDGDIINAKTVSDFITNSVSVQGSVFIPGIYDLSKASTVGELISASKGIMPDASSSLILYRTNMGVENEIISINLKNDDDLNIELKDQDRLVVFSLKDFEYINNISVLGEVNNPDIFDYKPGMTITDAIQLSNGFTDYADRGVVKIIRNVSTENNKILTEEFFVDFSEKSKTNKFKLLPDDIVSVAKIPFFQQSKFYSVKGQVSVQNTYPVSFENYSIKDAFRDNIILVENSSSDGIYIQRDSINIPVFGSRVSTEIFEPETNIEILNGDIIQVPIIDNTIFISGSVQQETVIAYEKSITFKQVINASGGFLENADKKRSYIQYQNGRKKAIKSFLGIKNYPKVLPGSKIFVPEKNEEKSRTSVAEIVGYTTSLVSIIALIKSF
jgi:protein involved in polysaccharide export with SLBB domain